MAENYIKLQQDISTNIEKAWKNFKKSPKERITLSYVEVRLEYLEQQWTMFLDNHRKLIAGTTKEILEATVYAQEEIYDKTEEIYLDYKAASKEKLAFLKKVQPEGGGKGNEQSSVKLPKIEIPKFSGKYSEWVAFRDMFISIVHNNTAIADVQKLHYLKGCLTGEAEQLLRHLPVTGDNYKICWDQLESRYNNKKYLSTCILKRLMGQKVIISESANAIKLLLDTTIECLHALENIGVNTSSWDVIIVFIISQKLDPESRKQWEQKVTESSLELPTLQLFEDFLENKFRSLEFLDQKIQRSNCTHVATTSLSCPYCNDNHKLCNCKKFAKCDVDARREFVQSNRLCFNCMNFGHSVYQCTLSTKCRLCKKKHHTMLHPKKPVSGNENPRAEQPVDNNIVATVTSATPSSQAQGETSTSEVVATCYSNEHSQVLLATALVNAQSNRNKTFVVLRSLLDQGSQASFVTEAAVQMLGLKKISGTSLVSGLGGDQASMIASKFYVEIKIQSRLDPSFTTTVKAYVLNKLTSFLPSKRVLVNILPALSSMVLADPSFDVPNKIDLLLGAEVYSQILIDGLIKNPPGSVLAQNTKLGWILSGRAPVEISQDEMCHNAIVNMHLTENSDDIIKKFWELEAEPDFNKDKILTSEEKACEELFSRTTHRDESGRYTVKLPFKTSDPQCKYNGSKHIALRRFLMLEKRFTKNPELKTEYSKVVNEYLELGHMEVVKPKEQNHQGTVYVPHQAVIREDKTTTKVRMVLDASCPGVNGASLNKDLMVGPTLQPDLRHLILRWRCYPIALVADIVKMYRQIKVTKEDADFQRILWRDSPGSELQHFRLVTVTFGTSSAPYLAVRALQQLAYDEGAEFPLARNRVLQDFYMDDLLTGCHSASEGKEIFEQMTTMLNRGGFPLQKWASNDQELLKHINSGQKNAAQNLELKTDETTKILGLIWNKEKDEFRCTIRLPELQDPVTKRKVISDIARLFDPLGWLAPVVTTAKIFIQTIWLSGIEWDDVLPAPLLKAWLDFRGGLNQLVEFRIPRWIKASKDDQSFELHGFSDASNAAYAAVVYARIIDSSGRIHVSLVTSKTRVAPVKQVSIPRLELCGAVLVAKLLYEVAGVLEVQKQHIHAWTDSSIVLAWLRSHPSRWKTFVANRVSEILTIMDGSQWSHVASKDNPADAASRGMTASEYNQNHLWNEGPKWLREENVIYDRGEEKHTNLEEKKQKVVCHTVTCEDNELDILSKFSSLKKLTRVLSYCRRVIHWKKPEKEKSKKVSKGLTAKEISDTHLICIKLCQKEHFGEEIKSLLNDKKTISKKSKLTSLNPFLDESGILRVGGRLNNASVSYDTKHPIIIPHKSHFTNLLIHEAHERTLHGGPQLVLNYLRCKYWVLGAKSTVRQFVRKCVTCVRHSAQTNQQMMGQLPISRVSAHRPFHRSGVDYAGPINIRTTKGRGHRSTKGYICLFVCMSTKAIHLEVVSDMTSQGFLAAFKRFVARRGHVSDMWSDNGTTFVGSAKELKELFDVERSTVASEIADWLASNGTNWHFIPPHSPNFGGLWEAGVKSTKHHLKRLIGNSTLTFEEMSTVLAQIEACLNSRPICQLSTNPEDLTPLTPGHFLVGEPLVLVPDVNYEASNISVLRRWHLTQKMVQDFWRRWSNEYLTQLQQRHKWTDQIPEPGIGDVVLVKEPDLPPARWLFGLVIDKHPGLDKLTRVVTLKYKGNVIKRPISRLIVLPVKDTQ